MVFRAFCMGILTASLLVACSKAEACDYSQGEWNEILGQCNYEWLE